MKKLLAVLGFIIVSVLVYLGFYNAFYSPKFTIKEEGGETVVYQSVNGRYQLTDSVMKVVFNELYEKNGIVITKGYRISNYNPQNENEKITALVAGCVVENKDTALLNKISEQFTIGKTLKENYIVSDFPLKGKMSIMFGMYRVYPKLNKYCETNGYSINEPVTEIYDRETMKIHYRRNIVKN